MIDRKALARMMDGDYDLADKLIHAFRAQMASQSAVLVGYVQSGQRDMLENAAHVMKTQSRYLGLQKLGDIAETLEHSSSELPSDQLLEQVALLQQTLEPILRTLDDQDSRTTS